MENETRKPPFKERLANFWYYYKWHSIVALILVFAVSVCTLQMCQNTSPDIYVMYAGGKSFLQKSGEDADVSAHVAAQSSLKRFTGDYNGDGRVEVEFEAYYIPTAKEIAEIEKNNGFVDKSFVNQNKKDFNEMVMYGDYLILIMSEELFRDTYTNSAANPFASLRGYTENDSLEFVNDYAVYLRSTALGKMPEFNLLPEDTVIAFRIYSEVPLFRPDRALYEHSEATLCEILK